MTSRDRVALLAGLAALVFAGAADADVLTVCSVGCDHTSIQAAVDAASSGDTIELGAETFTEHVCLRVPDHETVASLTLIGAGADSTVVDGSFSAGMLQCCSPCNNASLTVAGMTVRNPTGCGIRSAGGCFIGDCWRTTVRLDRSVVEDSACGVTHGGDSFFAVENSTITGNDGHGFQSNTSAYGGSHISSSTIHGNAGYGVYLEFGASNVGVDNSTVSGNAAGVVLNEYAMVDVVITQSTIAGNHGPGLMRNSYYGYYYGRFIASGSIVADNGQDNCWTESGGHNLSSELCGSPVPTDLLESDPQLEPLADNGGPTPTHALAPGSPAIDAAGAGCDPADQRGAPRPVDGNGDGGAECDIGAYEYLPPAAMVVRLIAQVESLGLHHGLERSLVAKLNATLRILEDLVGGNDPAAVNALGAFTRAVDAQRGKKIDEADADALIDTAQAIEASL